MVVSTDSSRTMPDWVKYGVFWHVYPLGFCGADIRPAGPRQFHGRGLDAIIPWLEYVRDLGASIFERQLLNFATVLQKIRIHLQRAFLFFPLTLP